MKPRQLKIFLSLLVMLMILVPQAAEGVELQNQNVELQNQNGSFFLYTSFYTHHWDYDPAHNNNQKLIGLEYQRANTWVCGGSFFKNTYSQSCLYIYAGKIYNLIEMSPVRIYSKFTWGVISGYDDEGGRYEVYWTEAGTFPAFFPTIGVNYRKISLELSLFANAGYILNAGIEF